MPVVRLSKPSPSERELCLCWASRLGDLDAAAQALGMAEPGSDWARGGWPDVWFSHNARSQGRVFTVRDAEAVGGFAFQGPIRRLPDGRHCAALGLLARSSQGPDHSQADIALEHFCRRLAAERRDGPPLDLIYMQASHPRLENLPAPQSLESENAVSPGAAPHQARDVEPEGTGFKDLVSLRPQLERLPAEFERRTLFPLLLLADDSAAQIERYLNRGEAWGVRVGQRWIGAAIATTQQPAAEDRAGLNSAELYNLAISSEYQGLGLGQALLEAVAARARTHGAKRLQLATAFEDHAAVHFYLLNHFRPASIDLGWFTSARGYPATLKVNGVPVRDRLWLERQL